MSTDQPEITGPSQRRRGMAVNTIAQAAPLLIGYVGSFASAPVVLASLGLRAFGVWALTGAVAQYASLLDFGVGPVLVRFIALHVAEGKRERIPQVLGTGCVTASLITAVLVGASFVVAAPLGASMHVSASEMQILLLCATVMFAASLFTNVLTAFAVGMQEMVGPNVATTLGGLLNFAFSLAAVLSSHSLQRYAEANAMASVLTLGVVIVFARRSMRGRTSIRLPSWGTAREILGFSIKGQALVAAGIVNLQTDKVIIAFAVGPAAAGAYELANRVAAAGRMVGSIAVGAMMPAMTAAGIEASEAELRRTYLRWTTISTALGTPVLLVMAAMPVVILHSWLGLAPPHSGLVLGGLSLAYMIMGTTNVNYILAAAKGQPGLPARAAVWTAIGNVVATVALAPFLGVVGVLIGTIIALGAGSLYQVWLVQRKFGIPFTDFIDAVRPSLLLGVVAALPLLGVDVAAAHSPRLLQGVLAVVCAGLYGIVYLCGANRLGLLPPALARRLPLGVTPGLEPVIQG